MIDPIMSMAPNGLEKRALRHVRAASIIHAVASGRYADRVCHVRQLCRYEAQPDIIRKAKLSLPCILPSGRFNHASGRGFCGEHSGIICADVDDVDPRDAVETIASIEWVAGWFVSPSGCGLKVFCLTTAQSDQDHFPAWATVASALRVHGIEVDKATKDINRLCYVSHDPDAVWRECTPLDIDRTHAANVTQALDAAHSCHPDMSSAIAALECLGTATSGRGGSLVTFKACIIGHAYGIDQAEWWSVLSRWNQQQAPPWDERELAAKLSSAYRNAKDPFGMLSIFSGVI